ncbi:MAG: methylated-DNA--[protein]-cysteine S-methyltransferase [Alphaproteobacteria bacterium]|nr:methylated-DNA--[protein]-cysteine S-methyltransferase [Alphaproteobacteria bacterium]
MNGPARRTMKSPLGPLTVSVSAGAIRALDWSAPAPEGDDPLLAEALRQLEDYFAGRRRHFDLPLAPEGPPHEQAVWQAMRDIGYGRTETYGELARRTGSVARAVGQACGANPIPIIIPCHRVMAAGGGYGGYSGKGGVETKSFLLRLEGAILI